MLPPAMLARLASQTLQSSSHNQSLYFTQHAGVGGGAAGARELDYQDTITVWSFVQYSVKSQLLYGGRDLFSLA